MTMTQAWEAFDKAVRFEEQSKDEAKGEGLRRTAGRAAERKLDEACALESAALAAGEPPMAWPA